MGYSMAGYRELLAVEWDDNAVATFRLNFPDVPVYHGDIHDLSVDECLRLAGLQPGQLDVLDGSPPCQGFSTAGKRQIDDARNSLFREYVRLLRGVRPRVFIMENVNGLVKGKMKLVFAEIMQELKASGYRVSCRLMNAMWFNVPQSRQRLIWIGVRDDLTMIPNHPIALRQAIALRRGWGRRRLNEGIKNKQFVNKWRSLDWPCVTLEKTRPPILLDDGQERELTLSECAIIGSFPHQFAWGIDAYQCIGNSVPPLFMRAIAEHVKSRILTNG